jgi:mevalonate kinase
MQDFKHIGQELKKNIEQMKTLTDNLLQKAQEKEPEKVREIMNANSEVLKAIKNKDVQVLTDLYKKYADNSH